MNANWLLDCEKFNEWMNELDYLVILTGLSREYQHTAPYLGMYSPGGVVTKCVPVDVTNRKCIKAPEGMSRKRPRSPSPLPGARKRKRCVSSMMLVVNMASSLYSRNTVRRKIKDDDVDYE